MRASSAAAVRRPTPTPHSPLAHTQALVRLGGALLELAHYRQGEDATNLIFEVSACCFFDLCARARACVLAAF